MAAILSREAGTTTIAAGSASNTATLSTTLTDTTHAVLYYGCYANDPGGQAPLIMTGGTITNTTTLTFTRGISAGTVALTVQWQVIEYSSGVTVQRGTQAMSAATVNVTISSSSLTTSWPMVSTSSTSTSSGLLANSQLIKANISTTTNLALTKYATGSSSTTAYWQVVTYDNCLVASYAKTVTAATNPSTTQAITSVTVASTLLFDSFTQDLDVNFKSEQICNLFLTNSTTVTYSRTNQSDMDQSHLTYTVAFSDSVTVQRAKTTITSTSTTAVTISTVNQTRSIVHSSDIWGYLGNAELGAWENNKSIFGYAFTANTTLTITRSTDAAPQTGYASWEVISWAAAAAAARTKIIWIPAI